jgi:acetylornithine deacetylase/succinyl-diaminopimelate desuccinylase-like protein
MKAIIDRFRGVPWQRVLSGVQGAMVPPINDDMAEAEIYRRYFFGPSVNLSGLKSGYTGPGTSTFTLPHLAEAFLDIRIPRNWDVQETLAIIRAHLDSAGFSDVEMQVFGAYNGSRVSRDATITQAADALFRSRGIEIIWWPMTGGGGPWSTFSEEFGMPLLRDVGMGHGRASVKDEYLVIEGTGRIGGMVEMALSHAEMMLRLAG